MSNIKLHGRGSRRASNQNSINDQRPVTLPLKVLYPDLSASRKARRTGYTGAELREMRKGKGVGRPPKSL